MPAQDCSQPPAFVQARVQGLSASHAQALPEQALFWSVQLAVVAVIAAAAAKTKVSARNDWKMLFIKNSLWPRWLKVRATYPSYGGQRETPTSGRYQGRKDPRE